MKAVAEMKAITNEASKLLQDFLQKHATLTNGS